MAVHERRGTFEVYVYRPDFGRKVYVGCSKNELEARALFREKTAEFAVLPSAGLMSLGIAAEHFAIGELLSRGHRVAKPVVDLDGVDLVVDYAIKVQVKSSSVDKLASKYKPTTGRQRRASTRYLSFHTARKRTGKPNVAYDVDVFVLFDGRPSNRVFYVVPVSEIPNCGTLTLTPKYEQYRDAWDWFRGAAA